MATWPFRSLRQRLLLVVLVGAVLPLALAGWWLSRQAVRSAERLLHGQLDTSLAIVVARAEERASYRLGDLHLLASNDVVVRTLAAPLSRVALQDSQYMAGLFAELRQHLPRIRLRTLDGRIVWDFSDSLSASAPVLGLGRLIPEGTSPRISLMTSVTGPEGTQLGVLEADLRLSGLLPEDSVPVLVAGAQFAVADRQTGRGLYPAGAILPQGSPERFEREGAPWMAVYRELADPPLGLSLAAPMTGYVGPFRLAASLGLGVVVGVAILAVVLTTFLTSRVTLSLNRLVSAADAVAAGDLARDVETNGVLEVGRLGRAFNTMTASLRSTLQELSHRKALSAVGEFAASLSHEVRNALTSVRLDLQRAEERLAPPDTAGELVRRALRQVNRLDTSVTGALAVARSGRALLEPVNLPAVLAASAAGAEAAFAASQATLSMNVEKTQEGSLRGDPVALEQLFLNLLLNAGQALSPGGRASVALESDATAFTVSIRDTGPGMPNDLVVNTARSFFSSKRGGTGLGLSIARKIAEAHGGELQCESSPGAGTVVRVRLPRTPSHGTQRERDSVVD